MRDDITDQRRLPELRVRLRSWFEVGLSAVAVGAFALGCVAVALSSIRMYQLGRLAGEGALAFGILSVIALAAILVVTYQMRGWVIWAAVSEDGFRVRRVFGEEFYAWGEMNSFEFRRHVSRSRETVPIFVPMGVGTLVGFEDIGEKISISTSVTARHFNGRVLARFTPDYPFTRWLLRMARRPTDRVSTGERDMGGGRCVAGQIRKVGLTIRDRGIAGWNESG